MLKNKPSTILLTGATGKLGTIFLSNLLENGHQVIITSRKTNKLAPILKTFTKYTKAKKLLGLAVDLTAPNASAHLIAFFTKQKCWPHTIINNARSIDHLKMGRHGMPTRKDWLGEFLLDVVVPFELSMNVVLHKNSKLKNIINIASMYGVVAANPKLYDDPEQDSPIQYSVAKAALIHLTKELAVRLAPKGIRVNCISYGGVEGRNDSKFLKRYSQLCPIGRMLKDDDVYGAIEFLDSEKSQGVTGHNLIVDGGWSIW